MKKLFFCFSLIFFSFSQLAAQTYVPFPTAQDSVAWKMVSGSWNSHQESYEYFSEDTIINAYTYSKIYKGNSLFVDDSNSLISLIREENKRIYTRGLFNNTEYLLYDFSLQLGDTLFLNISNSDTLILFSIDSIELDNNTFRKQFQFFGFNEFSSDTFFHVEGLGNLEYGYTSPLGREMIDFYIETSCIFSSNEVFYKKFNVETEDCYKLENSTSIEEIDNNEFLIFPNPTQNILHFEKELRNTKVMIFSLSGQKMFEAKDFSVERLDVSFLEKGVYYLKLEGEINGYFKLMKN